MISVEVSTATLLDLLAGDVPHVIVDGRARLVRKKDRARGHQVAARIARATYMAAMRELYGTDVEAVGALPSGEASHG